MKRQPSHARLAAALLIGAAVIPSTSAFAQETPAQAAPDVAPPPVVATVPSTPAPQAAPAPAAAVPLVQPIPQSSLPPTASDDTAPAPRRSARAATETRTVRNSTATRSSAPARAVEPAPAAPTAAAPPAPAPIARSAAPLPAPEQVPTQPQAPAAAETATTTQTVRSAPVWPWVVGAIALLALIGGALAMRRRREPVEAEPYREPYRDDSYREEAYREDELAVLAVPEPATVMGDTTHLTPMPVAEAVAETPRIDEPAMITPSEAAEASAAEAREHAVIQEPAAEELAGIVDATAPVEHRPWLEFGIRPVRAGTSHKDAMVEVELIVGNSGDVAAEDVHISTFMLPAGSDSEMDRLLTERHEDSVPPVTIRAGEGTKVDAVMSVPREDLNGDASFQPIVVADARYTLPDGREGRTSAAFRIGLTDEKGERFEPIGIEQPDIFHNVTAQLHGTPEHV